MKDNIEDHGQKPIDFGEQEDNSTSEIDDLWSRSVAHSIKELEACISILKQRANHSYDSIALKSLIDTQDRLSVVSGILDSLKAFHDNAQELETVLKSRR